MFQLILPILLCFSWTGTGVALESFSDRGNLAPPIFGNTAIFDEIERLILLAQNRVCLSSMVLCSKALPWEDSADDNEDEIIRTQSLIKIESALKKRPAKKIDFYILVNDSYISKFLNGLDIQNEVNKVVNCWIKNGVDKNKVHFKLAFYPNYFLGAMHSKMLLVDNTFLAITGMNFDKQFNNGPHEPNWTDVMIVISGPIVKAAEEIFHYLWNQCGSSSLDEFIRLPTDHIHENYQDKIILLPQVGWDWPKLFINTPLKSPQNDAFGDLLQSANKNIRIMSPNINSPHLLQKLKEKASNKNLEIQIITGFKFNNWIYGNFKSKLLGMGLTNEDSIQELQNHNFCHLNVRYYTNSHGEIIQGNEVDFNHSKILIIDDKAIIGSANQDYMSQNHLTELNVLILDANYIKNFLIPEFNRNWEKGKPAEYE